MPTDPRSLVQRIRRGISRNKPGRSMRGYERQNHKGDSSGFCRGLWRFEGDTEQLASPWTPTSIAQSGGCDLIPESVANCHGRTMGADEAEKEIWDFGWDWQGIY